MSKLVLLALSLTACAAGGFHVDVDSTSHAMPQLSLHAIDLTTRIARVPTAPETPNTDRLANQIRHVFGSQAVTEVKLCVRPSGKTVSVELVGGSALLAFDQAVVRDALAWQFAAIPGPDSVQSCELVAITYRPHR